MSVGLQQEWEWGPAIKADPSGFGRVVEAVDARGVVHAAKFVPKAPGATRELLMAGLSGVRNVVPVVDSGEINDEYVLVMPKAERSLRAHLVEHGPLDLTAALDILIDIAETLADLDGKVVHRDLKPENVLLLGGKWCVMDFGISRYADAITEPGVTRKGSLTPLYASPEQWRNEHATAASDVYSFGVMAFELLHGAPPFTGPDGADLRDQHLHSTPPSLGVGGAIASLVMECLFKSAGSRPTAENALARLTQLRNHAEDSPWANLAAVNHAAVQRNAEAQAETVRQQTEAERRQQLHADAVAAWQMITNQFHEVIQTHLGSAELDVHPAGHWHVELNGGQFGLSFPEQQVQRPEIPFDIVSTAVLSVFGPASLRGRWKGRSHSFYFADPIVEGQYGWYETAFMNLPFFGGITTDAEFEPFAAVDVGYVHLHHALGTTIGELQVAWPFTRVTPGDCEPFLQRWLGWFAEAASGTLARPSTMPEREIPRDWRRP